MWTAGRGEERAAARAPAAAGKAAREPPARRRHPRSPGAALSVRSEPECSDYLEHVVLVHVQSLRYPNIEQWTRSSRTQEKRSAHLMRPDALVIGHEARELSMLVAVAELQQRHEGGARRTRSLVVGAEGVRERVHRITWKSFNTQHSQFTIVFWWNNNIFISTNNTTWIVSKILLNCNQHHLLSGQSIRKSMKANTVRPQIYSYITYMFQFYSLIRLLSREEIHVLYSYVMSSRTV